MPRREDYRLRPVEEADLAKVLEWRNSERIRANMYTDHIISVDEHRRWFRNLREDRRLVCLVFEYLGRPAGMVNFTGIDEANGKSQWGFYLGETDLPRGTGTVMGLLGLEYAFEILKIRKVCGEAFAFNSASLNFFGRLGFAEEGRFARHVLKNGRYEDVVSFALFREDWERTRESSTAPAPGPSRKAETIRINGVAVGLGHPPYVIAEMSGNHNQSLERALEIVEAAAKASVQALKLQTYTADTMTLDLDRGEFFIDDPKSPWKGTSLYRLYQQAHTPWEWHKPIFDRCRELGIACFSTPFDETAVDFLETLGVPCYKIASFENTDLPLIRKVAGTGRPMIISTGMATEAELEETVAAARDAGCREIILLKCTSTYPAAPDDTNLLTIPFLRDRFDVQVGLSDHTLGIGVAVASVSLGATVIEKHITLHRADGGVDSEFSMEPEEMRSLVVETGRAWQALGGILYGPTEKEKASLKFRRSLYIVRDMKAGDVLTRENLRAVRPGLGLPPKHIDVLMGKTVIRDVLRGTPVCWEMIDSAANDKPGGSPE